MRRRLALLVVQPVQHTRRLEHTDECNGTPARHPGRHAGTPAARSAGALTTSATSIVTDTFGFYTRKSVRDHGSQADAAGFGFVLPPPMGHIAMITKSGGRAHGPPGSCQQLTR